MRCIKFINHCNAHSPVLFIIYIVNIVPPSNSDHREKKNYEDFKLIMLTTEAEMYNK